MTVTMPVAAIQGSNPDARTANACSVSKKPPPAGTGTPKKFLSCAAMMSRPAPAVNATTTVCEMKFTRAPSLAAPIASWTSPTMRASVSTSSTYRALPGAASGAIVANTTSEIAFVGPEIWCHDEPQRAAATAGSIAQ